MRKVICLILVLIMTAGVLCNVSAAEVNTLDKPRLSEMSEAECFVFAKEQGIVFPHSQDGGNKWGPFVKKIISKVEANPDYIFSYSYTVTQALAEDIKRIVNEYYDITPIENTVQQSASVTTTSDYQLQYSTEFVAWNAVYENYRCYGYAIGTREWVNPGHYSGGSLGDLTSVDTVASCVVADLIELGHTNVTSSGKGAINITNLCTNEKIICVRIAPEEDYHFMKLSNGSWYHKPGTSAPLKYKYTPTVLMLWTNEGSKYGVCYAGDLEYDSNIIFISYDAEHTYTYKHQYSSTTGDTHTRCCATCGDEFGLAIKCTYATGSSVCKICGTPKTSVADSVPGEPSVTAYSKTLTAAQ